MEILETKGNTEVPIRPGRRIMDVASLLDSKVLPLEIVDAVCKSPDYGGREATLPILAKAMQPRWADWWDEFRFSDIEIDIKAMACVLGDRQLVWLGAQSVRWVLEYTDVVRPLAESAIDFAEEWSLGRTTNTEEMSGVLWELADNIPALSAWSRARKAASAARSALMATVGDASSQLGNTVSDVAAALAPKLGRAQARSVIAYLFRQLITPTLITSANSLNNLGSNIKNVWGRGHIH